MEHEKRKKRQRRNKIIVTCLIIPILLLAALSIVFYAFGWRYDFRQNKLFLSSILYINSQPTNADIYLNDKLIGKTKIARQEVKPGDYNLKIIKDGFYPWETMLNVPAFSVVEVDPYLFYQNPKQEKEIKINKLLAEHNQTIVFNQNEAINYCDLPCDKTKELHSVNTNFKNIYLTNNKLYFEYANFYVAYDLNNQTKEKIIKLEIEPQKTVFNDRGIYVLTDNNILYQLTETNPSLIEKNVKTITANSDWLFYLILSGNLLARQDQSKIISQNSISVSNFPKTELNLNNTDLATLNDNIFIIQNNDYFLLNNNIAQYINQNLQNYTNVDGYSAWINVDGELFFKNPQNEKAIFINRYFKNPNSIKFFSPEYLILEYSNEIKIIEISTKQEFIIFKPNQKLDYIYPSSDTNLAIINSNSIKNYKITEDATFWQRILKIFRR